MRRGFSTLFRSGIQNCGVLYVAVFLLCLISGCQKSPINGDLDGQWQICEVSPASPEEILKGKLYYCFYMHTCQLTSPGYTIARGNFTFNGETISIDFPTDGEDIVTAIPSIHQYGIYSNPVTFNIVHLDSKKLVIENSDATITLRKY